jgi:glycosyltransferase involved in cell wall biosynthesis
MASPSMTPGNDISKPSLGNSNGRGSDLHIVAFAVPYPPHYGGAIDVWNRIRALHQAGLKITLHCFAYSAFKPHDAIKEEVAEVIYYPRITWPALLAPGQPYIVSSRKNPMLLKRLMMDKAPILFEGIHTTGFADELKDRKLLLRAHNVEHRYYNDLAKDSYKYQYLFFQRESLALERYECNKIKSFHSVFAISPLDDEWFCEKGAKSVFMPVYHGFEKPDITTGRGKYLLWQGDLSILSNQKAFIEAFKNIPKEEAYPIIVAGKSGDSAFEEKLLKYPNITRETDVSEEKMAQLIRDAQVILVHSRHKSGTKVKIFPALYQGRFVVANENSATHTGLDKALHIYQNLADLGPLLKNLWARDFTASDIAERASVLAQLPTDQEKAKEIIRHL